jgi:hypothetical protein
LTTDEEGVLEGSGEVLLLKDLDAGTDGLCSTLSAVATPRVLAGKGARMPLWAFE